MTDRTVDFLTECLDNKGLCIKKRCLASSNQNRALQDRLATIIASAELLSGCYPKLNHQKKSNRKAPTRLRHLSHVPLAGQRKVSHDRASKHGWGVDLHRQTGTHPRQLEIYPQIPGASHVTHHRQPVTHPHLARSGCHNKNCHLRGEGS
jgi:hypothetical protein